MPRPFIPLPNGVQVVIQSTLQGQTIDEVHYVTLPSTPGADDVQGVAQDFETWYKTDVVPNLASAITLVKVTATDWTSGTGVQFVVTEPSPIPGGVSGNAVNNTLAMVLSWHTARRGRSYRGRTYLAGLPTSALADPNTFTNVAVSAIDAAYVEIPGFNVTTPYSLVVASFYSGVDTDHHPIPRTTGIGTPINALSIVNQVYNQRRRRLGLGI